MIVTLDLTPATVTNVHAFAGLVLRHNKSSRPDLCASRPGKDAEKESWDSRAHHDTPRAKKVKAHDNGWPGSLTLHIVAYGAGVADLECQGGSNRADEVHHWACMGDSQHKVTLQQGDGGAGLIIGRLPLRAQ